MALPTRVYRQETSDPFDQAQRELNTLLSRFFGAQPHADGGRLAPYGVDVREDGDHFYVEAELPGFKKDDVDITLEDQTLTISAERRGDTQHHGNDANKAGNGDQGNPATGNGNSVAQKPEWLLRERRYTRFLRSFTLPPTVDEKSVDAKLQDGVLKITLNKREETKPRRIAVN